MREGRRTMNARFFGAMVLVGAFGCAGEDAYDADDEDSGSASEALVTVGLHHNGSYTGSGKKVCKDGRVVTFTATAAFQIQDPTHTAFTFVETVAGSPPKTYNYVWAA